MVRPSCEAELAPFYLADEEATLNIPLPHANNPFAGNALSSAVTLNNSALLFECETGLDKVQSWCAEPSLLKTQRQGLPSPKPSPHQRKEQPSCGPSPLPALSLHRGSDTDHHAAAEVYLRQQHRLPPTITPRSANPSETANSDMNDSAERWRSSDKSYVASACKALEAPTMSKQVCSATFSFIPLL